VPDTDNGEAGRIESSRTRFFLPNRIRWNAQCVSSEDYRASHIKRSLHGEDRFNIGAGEGVDALTKQLLGHLDGVRVHGDNRGGVHEVKYNAVEGITCT